MRPLSPPTAVVSSTRIYILRCACYFFLAFGILAMGYVGFVSAYSRVYETIEMKKFKQAGLLSEPHILAEGDVIGAIQVPRLGLNAIVVQGDSPANLRRAVGHLSKSALPGEWGNVALAGHRDTFRTYRRFVVVPRSACRLIRSCPRPESISRRPVPSLTCGCWRDRPRSIYAVSL